MGFGALMDLRNPDLSVADVYGVAGGSRGASTYAPVPDWSAANGSAETNSEVEQCFDALHYSGKRQGHEVMPVSGSSPAKQQSPPSGPPPAPYTTSAPIGEK